MEEIKKILEEFVAANNTMKQRDASWYESMGQTVGGSELAAITGKNSYSNIYDVIGNKIEIREGRNAFETNFPCLWGTLFEDVAAEYIKFHMGFEPIGTDITIISRAGFRYSPDGYIICGIKKNGKICGPKEDPALIDHYAPVMIEIKCPISRELKQAVPPMYLPQIWAGLEFSPPGTVGLFVDCKFRKCSIAQLNSSLLYDNLLHPKPSDGFSCVAWGMIGLFSDDKPADDIVYEYPSMTEPQFMQVLENIKSWEIKFSKVNCNPSEQILEWTNSPGKYLGKIIPWKLIDVRMVQVDPSPGYLEMVEPSVQEVHRIVNEAVESGNGALWFKEYMQKKGVRRLKPPKISQAELDTNKFDELLKFIRLSSTPPQ